MAIGDRDWDDPGQLDNLVRLFRHGRSDALAAPFRFFLASPIQPGEAVQVSCLAHAPAGDGWVEVSVGGHLLDTLHLPALTTGGGGRVRPPGGSAAARALYEVGPKRLTFKATGSHGTTCQQLPLEVTAPDVAGWWTWRWPEADRSCHWRAPYRVGGELTNLGAAAVRVVRAAFDEDAPDGAGRWLEDVTVTPAEVPPQGVLTVFCETLQSWEWTSWSAARGGEDYGRRFDYELHAGLEDEFGNRYRLRTRLPRAVPVVIAPRKRNWWRSEAAMRGAGIALLVQAACMPSPFATDMAYRIFGAGHARTWGGLARRVRELAAGPATASAEYATRVSWPRRLAVEEVFGGELSWPDRQLAEALLSLEFLVALQEALTEVESRWLGARQADDAEASRNQRSDHLDLLRLLHEEWVQASHRVGDLHPGEGIERDAEVPYRMAAWQAGGVPAPVLEDWERQGVPGRWIEDVVVAGGRQLWTPEGVMGYVRRALEAALYATRDLLVSNPEAGTRP
jgi:hypothetical protein